MSDEVVKEVLDRFDLKIEDIEDRELSWWGRFKRRYFNRYGAAMYVVGGNVTLVQVTVGKKLLAWFAVKFPVVVGFFAKVWSAIVSVAVGALHLITH